MAIHSVNVQWIFFFPTRHVFQSETTHLLDDLAFINQALEYKHTQISILQLFCNYGGQLTSHNVTGTCGGRDRQNPANTEGGD